jgi:hypothetical protein
MVFSATTPFNDMFVSALSSPSANDLTYFTMP